MFEQLISEGRINPETSQADDVTADVSMPTKRRRLGICYRRGRSGKKWINIAYRCWKRKLRLMIVNIRTFVYFCKFLRWLLHSINLNEIVVFFFRVGFSLLLSSSDRVNAIYRCLYCLVHYLHLFNSSPSSSSDLVFCTVPQKVTPK